MEKIKLTKEQTRELVALRTGHGPGKLIKDFLECPDDYLKMFRRLSVAQFSLALNGWNEVEPDYKIGDWVESTFGKGVGRVTCIDGLGYYTEFGLVDDGKNLRHATKSEIAEEKERRWWRKHGREPWELKEGDIVYDKEDGEYMEVGVFTDMNIDHKRKIFEVTCFEKDRKDVKE